VYTDMQLWTEIRRRVLAEGLSKRQACREYGLHWHTLTKILEHAEPPGYRQARPRPKRKLEPFLPIIHEILKQDQHAPRKQRHTAKRVFDRLRDEHHYGGGYTIVKDAVRAWRNRHAEVYMPLVHPPGEAQVDFGHAHVIRDGEAVKVAVFVMTLMYSDAVFCRVFPRECSETFLEGHRRAFEFFGGVPRRISYDNTKTAVAKIVGHRERELTRDFLRLQSHYLFDCHFCLVRRPNEKGPVEGLVGYTRRNFLVPVPRVSSLENLNADLERHCRDDLQRRLRGQSATKAVLLEEERPALRALPKQQFEARRVASGQADSLSLVCFDRNSYSVPTAYAHQDVIVIGGVEQVKIVCRDHLVAAHSRHWGREQVHFDPRHYLALLERKPGALDFARPLENWHLPACFDILRRRLEAELGRLGTREYIKVLRLLEKATIPQLADAIEQCLALGALSVDAVRVIFEARRAQPVGLFSLNDRPHLKLVRVHKPDRGAYRALAGGAS
jgi:transposase